MLGDDPQSSLQTWQTFAIGGKVGAIKTIGLYQSDQEAELVVVNGVSKGKFSVVYRPEKPLPVKFMTATIDTAHRTIVSLCLGVPLVPTEVSTETLERAGYFINNVITAHQAATRFRFMNTLVEQPQS